MFQNTYPKANESLTRRLIQRPCNSLTGGGGGHRKIPPETSRQVSSHNPVAGSTGLVTLGSVRYPPASGTGTFKDPANCLAAHWGVEQKQIRAGKRRQQSDDLPASKRSNTVGLVPGCVIGKTPETLFQTKHKGQVASDSGLGGAPASGPINSPTVVGNGTERGRNELMSRPRIAWSLGRSRTLLSAAERASPSKRGFGGRLESLWGKENPNLPATTNALVKKYRLLTRGPGAKRTELTRSPKRQPRKKVYFDTPTPQGKRCESRSDSASLIDVTLGGLSARRNIQAQLKRAAGRSSDDAFEAKVSELLPPLRKQFLRASSTNPGQFNASTHHIGKRMVRVEMSESWQIYGRLDSELKREEAGCSKYRKLRFLLKRKLGTLSPGKLREEREKAGGVISVKAIKHRRSPTRQVSGSGQQALPRAWQPESCTNKERWWDGLGSMRKGG